MPPGNAKEQNAQAGKSPSAVPASGSSTPAQVLSLRERILGSIGFYWIIAGLCTYFALSWLGRALVHDDKAEELWRSQVPVYIYDRSTFVFTTALSIDLLSILFERQTLKLDYVLLPAFIKGLASTTNFIVRFASPCVILTTGGRFVMLQRYICWMHTTASILMVVQLISTSIDWPEVVRTILWDELMLVAGVIALMTSGYSQVFWTLVTHLAIVPVLPYIHKGFKEATTQVKAPAVKNLMWGILWLNAALWVMFAVTWDLAMLDLISPVTEESLYLICDFSAKVLFSSTLMLSSFKGIEARRETAMRQIEESSKQKLIEELRHLLEQKERFMSSVSHELRTPLNGIIGISEGMLSGCCGVLPEAVRRQIYIIRTSGARLLALINDVMDAAALRQNKLVLKQEVVVLRHVVDDVLDLTRSLVDSEVELRNSVPPRITVLGDAGRLVQILNNLLGNASKFTRRGFIKVSARMFDGGSRVAIMVQDTGIGIPKSKLATIFLPFEQVDMSISRKYGGFGLGLNIVQELVRAHGGEIWVESSEGSGSLFTFTMLSARSKHSVELDPHGGLTDTRSDASTTTVVKGLGAQAVSMDNSEGSLEAYSNLQYNPAELSALASARPYAEDAKSASQRSAALIMAGGGSGGAGDASGSHEGVRGQSAGSAAGNSNSALHGRPLHHQRYGCYQVLSVDDDLVNQSVVRTMLSSTGYEVITYQSGPEALSYLQTCDALPDLVLLDCMMPEMDGYEVLRALRAMFPKMHVPVIMVSARAEEDNVVQGLEGGADDYVAKPFKRSEFLARVRCQLGDLDLSEDLDDELPASASSAGAQALEAARVAGAHRGAGRKVTVILAIDDDEINQLILQGMLRSQNMRYMKAKSGSEGLACLTSDGRPPDLVLLDCSLPDMSGFEVCRKIRASFSKAQLPIIMLSARPHEQAIVEGLNCGANDYVTKPFRRAELLARIRLHMRGKGSAADLAAARPPQQPAPGSLGALPSGASPSPAIVAPPTTSAPAAAAVPGSLMHAPPAAQPVQRHLPVSIRGSWAASGLLVASVPMARTGLHHLSSTFSQMAESVGLILVEATDKEFVAVALPADPLMALEPGAAVALLQVAQGLVDAAAAASQHGAGILPLHVVLHMGPATASAGVLFGPGVVTAKDLVSLCPPLAICATPGLVAALIAAGMTMPQRALQTPAGELLVVEAHPAAAQLLAPTAAAAPSVAAHGAAAAAGDALASTRESNGSPSLHSGITGGGGSRAGYNNLMHTHSGLSNAGATTSPSLLASQSMTSAQQQQQQGAPQAGLAAAEQQLFALRDELTAMKAQLDQIQGQGNGSPSSDGGTGAGDGRQNGSAVASPASVSAQSTYDASAHRGISHSSSGVAKEKKSAFGKLLSSLGPGKGKKKDE